MEQWGAERIDELVALLAVAAPDEDLTADELLTACYEQQPGVVLAPEGGGAAVAVGVGRAGDGALVAAVRLLVVGPERAADGLTGALLDAAEQWALERGAERIELGGALPFALWPAVDAGSGLVHAAGRRGYEAPRRLRSFAVPAAFRAPVPTGVTVHRAVRDDDVTAVTLAAASAWPRRSDEIARALDHGTCHAAFATSSGDPDGVRGEVVGLGCHSVTRATWVGPLVVRPEHRRRGVGHALLGQICRDLMIAEFSAAEVHGIDDPDAEAFLLAAGARPGRDYEVLVKPLGG